MEKDTIQGKSNQIWWLIIPLSILVGCLITGCYIANVFVLSDWSMFRANRHDPYDTTTAFLYSMAHNRFESYKSYLTPENWEFVALWLSEHQPISQECKSPWEMGGWAVGTHDTENNVELISSGVTFECPEGWYSIDIHGSQLREEVDGWVIFEWEEICEVRDGDTACIAYVDNDK